MNCIACFRSTRLCAIFVVCQCIALATTTLRGEITFLSDWNKSAPGDERPFFPRGVTVGPAGNVFVAEESLARIVKSDRFGNFIFEFDSTGEGGDKLVGTSEVAVSPTGEIYTNDRGKYRIVKFDSDGSFLFSFGEQGSADGQFAVPRGVAVGANGDVYIADDNNERVQVFNSDGEFLWKFSSPSSLVRLSGINLAPNGDIYTAQRNGTVQKFDPEGNLLYVLQHDVRGARNVAINMAGDFYVTATSLHVVKKFTAGGDFLETFGTRGSGDGQFNGPRDVAVSATGEVYVGDLFNGRISRWFDSNAWFSGSNYFQKAGVGSGELLGQTLVLDASRSLEITGELTVAGDGSLTRDGGGLTVGSMVIQPGGRFTIVGAEQSVGAGLTNRGTLELIDATIDGPMISPAGSRTHVVGTSTFLGPVSGSGDFFDSGTVVLRGGHHPGDDGPGTVNVQGDLTYAAGNTLFIELGGLLPGSQYDRVNVDGMVSLDGTLDVQLIDGFMPEPGDTFDVLTFAERTGTFAQMTGLNLGAGLRLDPQWTANSLTFTTIASLVADLTGNGFVDFEDLTILLANWNMNVESGLGNLVLPDESVVNFEDLTVLLADWTGPAPAGSPEAALGTEGVPEPSTLMLAVLATLGIGLGRWRRITRKKP